MDPMRLTKDAIERAKGPEAGRKERFIRDDVVRGLGVRVTASGVKSFIFEARIKGRPRRLTLGQWPDLNVALARERALEIRTAIAKGGDPHAAHHAEKHEATFGELADRYMTEYARLHKKPRSIADDEYYLSRYIPLGWRTRRLSDISRPDIERLHGGLGEEHGRYAANHAVRLLRHMLNRALDWGMLRDANPAARIRLFREQRRERYLSPEELQGVNTALLEEPDWRWRTYFPLALMLGTRKSELMAMRWADVDFTARTWRIPETKAGNSHLLPLPSPAMAILEALPSRGKSEWVFPGDGARGHIVEPAKAWQRIRRRAGVPDVRIHDLRHTLASWLVAQGFNLPLIGRALNHTQSATTARYAHLALDPVRAALEQTAALMMPSGNHEVTNLVAVTNSAGED
jgi:integrase